MNEVNWIGFKDSLLSGYKKFALDNYGEESYQAKENYINWLYKENPLSVKKEDFYILLPIINLKNNEKK